jgi:hypothetical protein
MVRSSNLPPDLVVMKTTRTILIAIGIAIVGLIVLIETML